MININIMIIIVVTDFEQNLLRKRDGGWSVWLRSNQRDANEEKHSWITPKYVRIAFHFQIHSSLYHHLFSSWSASFTRRGWSLSGGPFPDYSSLPGSNRTWLRNKKTYGKTKHNIFGLNNQLLFKFHKKERAKVTLLVIPLSEKFNYLFSQNILCLEIKKQGCQKSETPWISLSTVNDDEKMGGRGLKRAWCPLREYWGWGLSVPPRPPSMIYARFQPSPSHQLGIIHNTQSPKIQPSCHHHLPLWQS